MSHFVHSSSAACLQKIGSMDVWNWLRQCANCHASLPPINVFCSRCWLLLQQEINPQVRNLGPESFSVHSLWDWSSPHGIVESLVHARKGIHFKACHKTLAIKLLSHHHKVLVAAKNIVFPAKKLAKDHSWFLADALSEASGVPAHPVWLRDEISYKSLGRKDRWLTRHADPQKIQGPIVFVDDLWTTGATAHAIWRALGEPSHFNVCVLSYKTRDLRAPKCQ